MHLWGVITKPRFVERGKFDHSWYWKIPWYVKRYLTESVFQKKKINEDYSTWIEKYVFAIYGKKRLASVNEVRLEFFLKKNKPNEIKLISNTKYSDDSQLPPCSCVLKETTNQTKYITGFALY